MKRGGLEGTREDEEQKVGEKSVNEEPSAKKMTAFEKMNDALQKVRGLQDSSMQLVDATDNEKSIK